MKLFYIIVSSCLSIFLYFVLQSIWGPAGSNSCMEMVLYKGRLETSIEHMKDFKSQLDSDLSRLETDEARLRQEAYRVGLVGQDEVRIRLPMSASDSISLPGNIAPKPLENGNSQAIITGISISLGLVFWLFLMFINFEIELIGTKGRRRPLPKPYQGVRVQTASLE